MLLISWQVEIGTYTTRNAGALGVWPASRTSSLKALPTRRGSLYKSTLLVDLLADVRIPVSPFKVLNSSRGKNVNQLNLQDIARSTPKNLMALSNILNAEKECNILVATMLNSFYDSCMSSCRSYKRGFTFSL